MKITLDLTTNEMITLRDALIDKSLALRTGPREIIIKEDIFLSNPEVSERRKANYTLLRETADALYAKIYGIN